MTKDLRDDMFNNIGYAPESFIPDGKPHRFGRKDSCWYRYFINGNKPDACVYDDFRNPKNKLDKDDHYIWVAGSRSVKPKMIMANDLVKNNTPIKIDPSVLEMNFETFRPCPPDFPYLVKKGVGVFGDIAYNPGPGYVAVPFYGPHWEFRGYQRIYRDGQKKLAKGTQKAGAFGYIQGKGFWTFVGEGYATCSSLHQATGCSVVIAIDCGNIRASIESFHKATGTPYNRIVVVADNDENLVGEKGAQVAVDALGVHAFVIPNHGNPEITDANDFAQAFGLDALYRTLGGDYLKEAIT